MARKCSKLIALSSYVLRRANEPEGNASHCPSSWGSVVNAVIASARVALRCVAALSMVALALLTLFDVLGRYAFNVPVVGAVELTEMLMVGVIFSGIVLATLQREHVTVDLLATGLGRRGLRVQRAFSQLLATGISALLGATTWNQALSSLDYGDRTTMLGLPLAPMMFFMSVLLLVNALVFALQFWRDLHNKETHD